MGLTRLSFAFDFPFPASGVSRFSLLHPLSLVEFWSMADIWISIHKLMLVRDFKPRSGFGVSCCFLLFAVRVRSCLSIGLRIVFLYELQTL